MFETTPWWFEKKTPDSNISYWICWNLARAPQWAPVRKIKYGATPPCPSWRCLHNPSTLRKLPGHRFWNTHPSKPYTQLGWPKPIKIACLTCFYAKWHRNTIWEWFKNPMRHVPFAFKWCFPPMVCSGNTLSSNVQHMLQVKNCLYHQKIANKQIYNSVVCCAAKVLALF